MEEAYYDDLVEEVKAFLTQMYLEDENGDRISWPAELAEMVGWEEPTE